MGVAGIGQGKGVAQVEVCQHQAYPSRCTTPADWEGSMRQHAGIGAESEQPALQIVIEIFDRGTPELSTELDDVPSPNPGEVVQDLKALAGAAAGNAESGCAQIFKHPAKINLRQAELAGAKVDAQSRRIESRVLSD